jgi:endonuclease/exonuclease/phosphatase family metal-dependent hydrolase
MEHVEELIRLTNTRVLKEDMLPMIFQSHSPQDLTSHAYTRTNMPHQIQTSQLKIVSFNIWDLPYWFVKDRKQRMHKIAEYLQRLDAEIICLQESFDVHHRRLLYEHLGLDRYYASGGFEATRKVPLASFDTTGGLVIFSKFPMGVALILTRASLSAFAKGNDFPRQHHRPFVCLSEQRPSAFKPLTLT